jgi:beta-lactamase regulating signal transducer with metallopeptidase domain
MILLLSVSIKIALLMLGALATAAVLHRRSAALRHWVLTTTLFCSLCLPVLELMLPSWSLPIPQAWTASSATSSIRFVSGPTHSVEIGRATTASPAAPEGRLPLLTTMVATAWIAGAVIGVALLLSGLLRLRKLAFESEPVSSGLWRDVANDVSRLYGIRRPVRILCCRHPTMLATWGMVNPTILLPAGAREWGADRIHAVVHHELAHVLRRDWAVALTANLLRAVHWFNPLLWVACRRLRHESERACDDLVLASGMSGAEYATHLVDVARESARHRFSWSPAIAIAHRSMLEGRVRAMLNVRLNREPVTAFIRLTTVTLMAAATLSIGVVSLSGNGEAPTTPDVSSIAPDALPVPSAAPEGRPVEARPSLAPTPAQTKDAEGTIEGVLYDQFGGLLPGASVKLTAVAAGGSQNTLTDRSGAFVFRGLATGDYELVTELPGFITVRNVVRAEPGATVRRHITLPIGTIEETIHVTCVSSDRATTRPTAPTSSASPGAASRRATTGQRGTEPKLPGTFTGGIGGQIKVPLKLVHVSPICPSSAVQESTVVRLAGRIGIDGLFTDLHNISTDAPEAYVASALDAARQWVFSPTLLNGAPIEVNISVTVSYARGN